jgi:hypothetical protein
LTGYDVLAQTVNGLVVGRHRDRVNELQGGRLPREEEDMHSVCCLVGQLSQRVARTGWPNRQLAALPAMNHHRIGR